MDTYGVVLLLIGAVVVGFAVEAAVTNFMGDLRLGYSVVLTIVGAAVGGFVASEYLGGTGEWGYEYEGLYVFPALIGALIVGTIVEVAMRYFMRPERAGAR